MNNNVLETKCIDSLKLDIIKPTLSEVSTLVVLISELTIYVKKLKFYLELQTKNLSKHYNVFLKKQLSIELVECISKINSWFKKLKKNQAKLYLNNGKFNLEKCVNDLDKIAIDFIDRINIIAENNKTITFQKKYFDSYDELKLIFSEYKQKINKHFTYLKNNMVMDSIVSQKILQKSLLAETIRVDLFNKFFDKWEKNIEPGNYFCKDDEKKYKYCLTNFYLSFDKLKSRQDKIFWKLEVKKVKQINKPHSIDKKYKKKNMFNNTPSNYVIELKNVIKYYTNGVTTNKVLKGVDLQIEEGKFVVILGPSGSGKTTLLNIISGMDRASLGKTIVANTNLIVLNDNQLTEFRRMNVGYIFQQYGLLPNLTVKENIEIGAYLQKDSTKRLDIDELLKKTGMYEYRNKMPTELSGGQQQRVSILRGIAKNPRIIFGDEPTGALDEEMAQNVLEQFVDINKKYKTTLIIVTHNPLIAEIASVVIHIGDGRIKNIIYNEHPKSVSEVKWSTN